MPAYLQRKGDVLSVIQHPLVQQALESLKLTEEEVACAILCPPDDSDLRLPSVLDQTVTVRSERGVHQGCTLGTLLFAVTIRPIFEEIDEEIKKLDPEMGLVLFADDGLYMIFMQHAAKILQIIKEKIEPAGLQLNISKTALYAPVSEALPQQLGATCTATIEACRSNLNGGPPPPGIGILSEDNPQLGITCCGVPIGSRA